MESRSPSLNAKQPKTPTHTLVRVRNNQRRHRQRRREYIESLERELKDSRQAVTQLKSQNKSLMEQLLGQHSQQEDSEGGACMPDLNATSIPPSIFGWSIWNPWYSQSHLQTEGIAGTAQITAGAVAGIGALQSWNTSSRTGPSPRVRHNAPACAALDYLSEAPTVSRTWAAPELSRCCLSPPSDPASADSMTIGPAHPYDGYQTSFNHYMASTTMLCSRAYIMIELYNRRGVAMEIVDGWLWPGFIWADPTSSDAHGCSVDSSLLLQVLSYIAEVVDVL